PRDWGRLYALNTLGAVAGALLTAWLLLPNLGFARTAWALGGLLVVTALPLCPFRWQVGAIAAGLAALGLAGTFESGIGRERTLSGVTAPGYQLVAYRESPDSTVSVLDVDGRRWLLVDGFSASDETKASHYMEWMGRLPMLFHPEPKRALVICFGTGQTANAVRHEGPEHLDIVDISRAVFDMAGYFPTNEGVLGDPRVRAVVMDGRAWLRRTDEQYDVITLEPMP